MRFFLLYWFPKSNTCFYDNKWIIGNRPFLLLFFLKYQFKYQAKKIVLTFKYYLFFHSLQWWCKLYKKWHSWNSTQNKNWYYLIIFKCKSKVFHLRLYLTRIFSGVLILNFTWISICFLEIKLSLLTNRSCMFKSWDKTTKMFSFDKWVYCKIIKNSRWPTFVDGQFFRYFWRWMFGGSLQCKLEKNLYFVVDV